MEKSLKKRLKKIEDRLTQLEAQSIAVTEPVHIASRPIDAQQIWKETSAELTSPYYYEDEEEEVYRYNGYL